MCKETFDLSHNFNIIPKPDIQNFNIIPKFYVETAMGIKSNGDNS